MAKPRDHAAEHRRRVELAAARGYDSPWKMKQARRAGRPSPRDPYIKGRRNRLVDAGPVKVATTGPRGGQQAVAKLDRDQGKAGGELRATVTFGTRSGPRTIEVTIPAGGGVSGIVQAARTALAGKSAGFAGGGELDVIDITATTDVDDQGGSL